MHYCCRVVRVYDDEPRCPGVARGEATVRAAAAEEIITGCVTWQLSEMANTRPREQRNSQ